MQAQRPNAERRGRTLGEDPPPPPRGQALHFEDLRRPTDRPWPIGRPSAAPLLEKPPPLQVLLQLDGRTSLFELALGLVGLFLGHLLEDGLRRRVDQVLGLLEPEAGERADLLDDL